VKKAYLDNKRARGLNTQGGRGAQIADGLQFDIGLKIVD